MRDLQPRELVEQTVGAEALEVAADLVELLTAVVDDVTGLARVAQVAGEFEHAEIASCCLLLRGHVVLR